MRGDLRAYPAAAAGDRPHYGLTGFLDGNSSYAHSYVPGSVLTDLDDPERWGSGRRTTTPANAKGAL